MLQQGFACARTWQINFGDFPDRRLRTVGHHDHAVCEQDRFVHIMRYADRRDLGARPDFHQHFLKLPASQAVEHAEGLIK